VVSKLSLTEQGRHTSQQTVTTTVQVQEIQRQFMQQSRIPGIVGAIDCTYIPIQSPGGDTAESSFCLLSIIPFLLFFHI
jgi:hypothetical protein